MKNVFSFLIFFVSIVLGVWDQSLSAHEASTKKYPKVSVICPTYDRQDRHPNLYQAFAWQTYDNRELLILDDSPEPSPFFVQLRDPKVQYYHHPKKSSIGSKRNHLIEIASGEIIAHFDDDDYYAPSYLAEMVEKLGDADFIKLSRWLAWRELDGSLWEWDTRFIGNIHFLVNNNSRDNVPVNYWAISVNDPNFNTSDWIRNTLWGFGFSYVYRKSLWEECHFLDVNFQEDYHFVSRAMVLGKKCIHIPDLNHLVLHTLHAKSCSHIYPQYQHPAFLKFELLEKNCEPWLVTLLKPEVIDKELLRKLFESFWTNDPCLKSFVDCHRFNDYQVIYVENRDAYYIEKETSDFIKTDFIKKGIFWEKHIYAEFQKFVKPGSTVVDIGGHIGTHTLSLSRLIGNSGAVHVFEPQAKLFSELVLNMHLNSCRNVIFHRMALGDKEQLIEMNPSNTMNERNNSIGSGGDLVPMKRLDDFQLTNVSLIKINIEGHEDKVIEGALQIIMNQKPVLVIKIWSNSEASEKIRKIEHLGYQTCKLHGGVGYDDYLFIPIGQLY